jgi:stage II sporulation protein D
VTRKRDLMRHLLLIATSLAVAVLAASATAAAPATPAAPRVVFVVDGGGWGHGVGMSQWGAYGQARESRTYADILSTYYPGTTLARTAPRSVRVLVAHAVKTLRVSSKGAFRLKDAAGAVHELEAGELTLGPRLEIDVDGVVTPLTSPLTISSTTAAAPLALQGTGYRGKLTVTSDGKTMEAINTVGLELYLQGVVPGEMPRSWPLEALKAQAVAARTYALVSIVKGKPFDLYSDWRSQVYYGVEEESTSTTRAVRETRGRILTFGGAPAQTLYFSSSGGRTRSAVDVYGTDFPYLVAVDDPWDDVTGNPNHRWQPIALPAAKLAAALKVQGLVVDATSTTGTDGRPTVVTFTTSSGAVKRISARDIRQRLALRSTSFRLGVLSLASSQAAADAPYRLEGLARAVDEPWVERLVADGSWVRARRVVPRADGTFRVFVRPGVTTTYRLTGTGLAGPSLTISVPGTPA